MKRVLQTLILVALCLTASAQKKGYLVVQHNNGTVQKVKLADVARLSFGVGEVKDDDLPDTNTVVEVNDFVAFQDGMVTDWTFGSTAASFNYIVYTKSGIEGKTDKELYSVLSSDDFYTKEKFDYMYKSTDEDFYKPDTEYCLVAVARNAQGVRGPIMRYPFKTLSTSLPYAEISNVQYDTTTKMKWTYDIALKNKAKGYYLATDVSENTFTEDWHWYAYVVHYWITSGQITDVYDWTSVQTTLNSGECKYITICTWGAGADNSIGGCNVAYGSVDASSRQDNASRKGELYESMPKDKLLKDMETVSVCKVK